MAKEIGFGSMIWSVYGGRGYRDVSCLHEENGIDVEIGCANASVICGVCDVCRDGLLSCGGGREIWNGTWIDRLLIGTAFDCELWSVV